VEQLLNRGHIVKVVVRSPDRLPAILKNRAHLTVIHADVLDLSAADMARHVDGCDAVASCLGHNISLKGIFGHPRRLVVDATRRLCDAINSDESRRPARFVLMNTTANRNRDLPETRSIVERGVFCLIRLLLPPQLDNEMAADYLRANIGQDDAVIEWAIVRPDTLIDDDKVTRYEVFSSPTRSPIFNPGSTSRINVGHFMADLITDDHTWNRWRGRMPVIYDSSR
jgi:nucleoside-diphosphate-sugar epimerase